MSLSTECAAALLSFRCPSYGFISELFLSRYAEDAGLLIMYTVSGKDFSLCFSRLTLDSSVDIACFSMRGSVINVRS